MFKKVPLAWLQLTREKSRLLIALAGISFADILMFMQLGFRDSLFDASVLMHQQMEGDIFLVSPQSTALIAMKSFPERRLFQSLAVEGVESIAPVYIGLGLWRNPDERNTRSILVIGTDPVDRIFDFPGLEEEDYDRLKLEDTVLFDRNSRPEFGPVAEWFDAGRDVETEIDGRRIEVGGTFELGATFGADGNLIVSELNFLRIFAGRDRGLIDIGVVQLEPGTAVEPVLAAMRENLPDDVWYFSKEEFVNWEKNYWQSSTAIGFIFALGAGMGFVVGIVIVYQILYTDVADHLPEYATLKAMGYTDRYLLGVVFQEAIILAFVGYLPGLGICMVLYNMTAAATSLPVFMTVGRATTVFILTVVMCFVSGAVAVRKLSAADPADIF